MRPWLLGVALIGCLSGCSDCDNNGQPRAQQAPPSPPPATDDDVGTDDASPPTLPTPTDAASEALDIEVPELKQPRRRDRE